MTPLLLASWFIGSAHAAPMMQNDLQATGTLPLASGPRGIGLGASFGEPTGIAVALRSNDRSTFAGVAGWSLVGRHLHVHADYLLTAYILKPDPSIDMQLEFFLGVGPSLDLGYSGSNAPAVGIRVPSGVALTFGDSPLDVFVDVVPVMGLVPNTQVYFDGALGVRVWLDPN